MRTEHPPSPLRKGEIKVSQVQFLVVKEVIASLGVRGVKAITPRLEEPITPFTPLTTGLIKKK